MDNDNCGNWSLAEYLSDIRTILNVCFQKLTTYMILAQRGDETISFLFVIKTHYINNSKKKNH